MSDIKYACDIIVAYNMRNCFFLIRLLEVKISDFYKLCINKHLECHDCYTSMGIPTFLPIQISLMSWSVVMQLTRVANLLVVPGGLLEFYLFF